MGRSMNKTPHTRKLKTVKFNIYKKYKKYGKHSSHAGFRDSLHWNTGFSDFNFPVFTFSDPALKIGKRHDLHECTNTPNQHKAH